MSSSGYPAVVRGLFPLRNIGGVRQLLCQELKRPDPNLALLSIVVGYLEHKWTEKNPPSAAASSASVFGDAKTATTTTAGAGTAAEEDIEEGSGKREAKGKLVLSTEEKHFCFVVIRFVKDMFVSVYIPRIPELTRTRHREVKNLFSNECISEENA